MTPELVFYLCLVVILNLGAAYMFAGIGQRVFVAIAIPTMAIMLAATVMLQLAPPPPPLSPAEQAKVQARQDAAGGYALGLATGMAMGR